MALSSKQFQVFCPTVHDFRATHCDAMHTFGQGALFSGAHGASIQSAAGIE